MDKFTYHQARKNIELKQKYDQEVIKCKQLKKDISDLQLLLHQARTALNKEVAFKSTVERYSNHVVRTDLLPDPLDIRYEEHYRNSSRKFNEVFRKIPDPTVTALAHEAYNTDDENEANILSKIEAIDLGDVSPLRYDPQTEPIENQLTEIQSVALEALSKPLEAEKLNDANFVQCPNKADISLQNDDKSASFDFMDKSKPTQMQDTNQSLCESILPEVSNNGKSETPADVYLTDELHSKFLSIDEPIEADSQSSIKQLQSEPKEILKVSEPIIEEKHLTKLDLLEKDPILQKYMDLIAEKRRENTSMIDPDSRLDSFTAKLEVIT